MPDSRIYKMGHFFYHCKAMGPNGNPCSHEFETQGTYPMQLSSDDPVDEKTSVDFMNLLSNL